MQPIIMTQNDWNILLGRIKSGRCTPFIGAEATSGALSPKSEIARELAARYNYPLEDTHNLARVAQFISTTVDPFRPKEEILAQFEKVVVPDFSSRDEIHRILADLPLPVYITTNYDNFMVEALKRSNRDAQQDLCKWNETLRFHSSIFDSAFTPTVANPVVFHLHGHIGVPESLVLTEDDYLDFLVNTSREKLIPARIEQSFTHASLLFLGYRIDDLEFRVLLRSLVNFLKRNMTRSHVTAQFIQVENEVPERQDEIAGIQEYFVRYCADAPLHIRVCWVQTSNFVAELRQQWEAFKNAG